MVFNPVPGQLGPIHPDQIEAQNDRHQVTTREADERVERIAETERLAQDSGVTLPNRDVLDVPQYLQSLGVDPDKVELRTPGLIELMQARVDDPNDPAAQDELRFMAGVWSQDPELSSIQRTEYTDALELSGFGAGTTFGGGAPTTGPGAAYAEGFGGGTPNYEVHGQSGWVRFKNGVLVNPNEGRVVFDPTSQAPGSAPWLSNVVANWKPEKVQEWKQRLHEYGYLTKEQAKSGTVDTVFRNALTVYHQNRYLNNGKPVVGDASIAEGGGEERPKLVDLKDFSSQIRNDVREQYRRVFGVDPSDGEVEAWSEYIISHGMDLQRKFRRKYGDPQASMASTEAEERFIEKLENSPQAEYLRDADEENTRLRDTFERMAVVTNSLTS